MKFAHENLANVKQDILPLLDEHWREIALNQDVIKLNPHWEAYAALDAAGRLRVYTARENGELLGYFVLIVAPSLHYKDHIFANNDIIFLRADVREGFTGIKLIKYAVECLEREGVRQININTKVHQPFDKILERQGFENIERVYSKCMR